MKYKILTQTNDGQDHKKIFICGSSLSLSENISLKHESDLKNIPNRENSKEFQIRLRLNACMVIYEKFIKFVLILYHLKYWKSNT